MKEIIYRPIGIIHSPFQEATGMPIQPTGNSAAAGTVEVFPQFSAGLVDLEGFSHLILLYHFHRTGSTQLTVTPFLDNQPHGIFATRAPSRPNPLGLSIVRLIRREQNMLHVANLDIVDGAPLLDIKPYVPAFDAASDVRVGWLEHAGNDVQEKRADDRFG